MNTEALIQETLKEITGAPNIFKFAAAAEELRSDPQRSKSASTMCHLLSFIIPCPYIYSQLR